MTTTCERRISVFRLLSNFRNASLSEAALIATTTRHSLSLRNITAGYGGRLVLDSVSLSLKPGEILCLIGRNGAGKSTIVKTALGILRPHQGVVSLMGEEVTNWPVHRRVRGGMAYLRQGIGVFPSLTARENLAFGSHHLDAQDRSSALTKLLSIFPELEPNLERQAGLLSGGQQQLLSLAATLLRSSPVLLLDEPTAGLAPSLAKRVLRHLSKHVQSTGSALLLIEQRVPQALKIADRAVLLDRGDIIENTCEPDTWIDVKGLRSLLEGEVSPANHLHRKGTANA